MFSNAKQPFEDLTSAEVIQQVQSGVRLDSPPGTPEQLYNLMLECWSELPQIRPTFAEICNRLDSIMGDKSPRILMGSGIVLVDQEEYQEKPNFTEY